MALSSNDRSRSVVETAAPETEVDTTSDIVPSRLSKRNRALLGAVAVAFLVWIGRRHFTELDRLREADPLLIFGLIAMFLINRVLNTEVLWIALNALGRRVGRIDLLKLTFVRSYTSLLIPRAGVGAATVYLKVKHGVSYTDSASLLLPMVVLELVVIGTLGLATQLVFASQPEMSASPELTIVFGTVLICGLIGLLIRVPISGRQTGRLASIAHRLNTSWKKLGRSHHVISRVLLIHSLQVFARAFRLYLAYSALETQPSFLSVLAASLLADVMFVISLTPNALGFREAAIVYAARLTGVSEAMSLTVAVLDRLVVTLTVVIIAQFVLYRVARE